MNLAEAHRAFLKAQSEMVDPVQLRRWWPLFAVAAAAGFLPITLGGIEALMPSAGHGWADRRRRGYFSGGVFLGDRGEVVSPAD